MLQTTQQVPLTQTLKTSITPAQGGITNTVRAGSIVQLPVGSIVPVNVNGQIVNVKTVPAPVQQTTYSTQSIPAQTYQTTSIKQTATGPTPTPQLRTLPPRYVKNELPAQYKTVTLPAKYVTTRLPPIGPPPTPANLLSVPTTATSTLTPPVITSTLPPETVTSVPVPPPITSSVVPQPMSSVVVAQPAATTVTNVIPAQQFLNKSIKMGAPIQSLPVQTVTTSINPIATPFGTTPVGAIGTPLYSTGSSPVLTSQIVPQM